MVKKKRTLALITCLIAILMIGAFYNGLVTRSYTVATNKTEPVETIRIVLIADLHSHIYGEKQKDIIGLIKKQKPDIIALAGDIADDVEPLIGTKQLLEGIEGLAPVYYVSGNHEYWSDDIKSIKALMREYGVFVLESSYDRIKVKNTDLIIAGVDDPEAARYEKTDIDWQEEMYRAFEVIENESCYKILLAHRPELANLYKALSFDLVLSGHSHGGQVIIPFILNGLFAPNQGWFPKYAGGIYKYEGMTHIVSRGVSFNPYIPRIFNPPEIDVIDIKGSAQKVNE